MFRFGTFLFFFVPTLYRVLIQNRGMLLLLGVGLEEQDVCSIVYGLVKALRYLGFEPFVDSIESDLYRPSPFPRHRGSIPLSLGNTSPLPKLYQRVRLREFLL